MGQRVPVKLTGGVLDGATIDAELPLPTRLAAPFVVEPYQIVDPVKKVRLARIDVALWAPFSSVTRLAIYERAADGARSYSFVGMRTP